MNQNEQEDEIKQISKYNDANFSILRLNEMWMSCRQSINNGNLLAWKTELDNIWLELYNDTQRNKDTKELLERNTKFKTEIARSRNRTALFNALIKRHEFLRQLQDMSGKAGLYIDEDEQGFE